MVAATCIATTLEKRRPLPVDTLVPEPIFTSTHAITGIRYDGYDPISQVPSELTAIGAPTRALWVRLGWIYTVLVTAFGIGCCAPCCGGPEPREERRHMCRPVPFKILEGEARFFAVRGAS